MPGKPIKKQVHDQEGLTMILNRLDQLEQNMKNEFQQVDHHLQRLDRGQDKTDQRLATIDHRLDRVDQRLERVDQHLERVDQHLEQVDQHLEQVDQRLEQVDQRLEQVDQRLEQVDQRLEQVDQRLEQVDQRFEQADQHLTDVETSLRTEMQKGDKYMSLPTLPPPSFEAESFEEYWQRRCAQSEFLKKYSEGPPLSREQLLEIIDEQYQVTFSENYSDEQRKRRLAFLADFRKSVADHEAISPKCAKRSLSFNPS